MEFLSKKYSKKLQWRIGIKAQRGSAHERQTTPMQRDALTAPEASQDKGEDVLSAFHCSHWWLELHESAAKGHADGLGGVLRASVCSAVN